jgi:protease-4
VFEQLLQLKARGKPLIVSMSTLAASGGYYIAMPADEIWASESTITGSIGVGALVPTFQRSLDSLGVSVDGIGTTRLAGQLRLDRELGDDMRQLLQMTVERAYRVFIEKVAAERGLSVERASNVARGRVWIGTDALELGLIDEFGGLKESIEAAARRAELGDGEYGVKYVERELTLRERLALELTVSVKKVLGALGMDPDPAQGFFTARIVTAVKRELAWLDNLNDPRGLYSYCFCELP